MKHSTRMIIATLAVAGALAGGAAYAARGDGYCGPGMRGGAAAEKFVGNRLERLHGELKLSPEQEGAWKTWSGAMQEKAAKMKERRPDFEALAKLPAPERMAQMLERHKERQKEMEDALASLRSFYGTLTPEQQKVFDRFQPFGGPHRGAPRGGEGRPGRG
ncbi:Spy/CpxP family protein refolding chaperone [Azospira restricta]|uniref:Spy/CpxP family protein refolding chaperone n=1 Tax=Azospira restricta TaxID=404405 RepID=A0A974SMX4_9RHOO|nr:Spy/CpxP family protein refolding chaperone [Azospira restricta]QRJ62887.1 Spy/CpxP family protein refolding chaperone [Azospira restricta]